MGSPTILVVDDDPVIVELLRVNFEMEGYRVRTAADGRAGLESALREPPDLVLFDVMMPGLDGLEAARRLRADERSARTGVILLSAKAQGTDVSAGLAVADDYVTKPFDAVELLARAAAVVQLRREAG